jgi:uncharacterized protein (DUF2147 family)
MSRMRGLSNDRVGRASTMMALACLASAAVAADDADRILGLWYTDKDEAQVRIERASDGYQGTIVWLAEPVFPADDGQGMAGKPKVDRENPDPALRTRPVVGLRIMQGFRFAGEGEWRDGSIYDPNNGKTYRCRMRLTDDGRLHVRGYIGISLLGRTTAWRRVPGQ